MYGKKRNGRKRYQKRYHRKQIGNDGFSIVEAMVAVVILSIIFIPITKSFLTSIKASHETEVMQEAMSTAQTMMEEFKEKSLLELYHTYNHTTGVEFESDVWNQIQFEHEITQEENGCCDLQVDIQVSRNATKEETGGIDSINEYEMPQIYAMDSPSSYILDIGGIPLWMLNELCTSESLAIETVKTRLQREIDITLSSDSATGNTKIACTVTYLYNGSTYKPISYGEVTLSESIKNLYFYYIADYTGQTDFLNFHNDEAMELNVYVMGNGANSTVSNFQIRQGDCSNLYRCNVITNVLITGMDTYNVSSQDAYVPVKEKETRRYEIVVTVKKKSNGKEYISLVSTRGE